MAETEILQERDVTKENLAALFRRAFFSTRFDSDGDLIVETDGPRVLVKVDPDKKMLKYLAAYGIDESSPLELKHALANKMNDRIIFVRFSIPEAKSDALVADYFIPYEGGIPAFQIISALRWFARVVPGAILTCDDHDLVK
jgi:hypothetical protein